DRRAQEYTRQLMEAEARMSREAWVIALQAHVTTLQGQQGLGGDPTHLELPEEAGGKARMSKEAWTRAIDVSDLVHGEVISLRTTVLGQIPEMRELQAADRRRQTVISELLSPTGTGDSLAKQVATLQGLARDSTHPEPPEEAGGSA
nr:hypothetical protein [Tanacetum cinerariifolium]